MWAAMQPAYHGQQFPNPETVVPHFESTPSVQQVSELLWRRGQQARATSDGAMHSTPPPSAQQAPAMQHLDWQLLQLRWVEAMKLAEAMKSVDAMRPRP
mmetsp:Transcript_42419/g.106904  ORF Transcript_42419/g.106904 Transcript_42419/m.106904 type:complete len:99 (+) Transcript_42419:196-492(+)